MRRKRHNWQARGFRSYADYLKSERLKRQTQSYVDEYRDAQKRIATIKSEVARRNKGSRDRLIYHSIRLQELANGNSSHKHG